LLPRRLTSATSPHPTRPPVTATSTTGNRGFAESNILRRELNLVLSANNFFTESKKNSRRKILCREYFLCSLRRIFFKKSFFHLQFFYHQHALIQKICSNLTPFYLCLLYLKFLLHSRYFFEDVQYELQVHEIIE
jgi:hypothetical protein